MGYQWIVRIPNTGQPKIVMKIPWAAWVKYFAGVLGSWKGRLAG